MEPDIKKSHQNNRLKNNETDTNNKSNKKPFDKKTYRLKKYSNKYKVDKWEEKRKKSIIHRFYNDLHKTQKNDLLKKGNIQKNDLSKSENTQDNEKSLETSKTNEKKNYQPNAFMAAKLAFKKKQEQKDHKIKAILKAKAEREEAIKKYKEKKFKKTKMLTKNTRKGQPIMKDRLEFLLEKIQENV